MAGSTTLAPKTISLINGEFWTGRVKGLKLSLARRAGALLLRFARRVFL